MYAELEAKANQLIVVKDVSTLDGGLSLQFSSYDLVIALKNFKIKLNRFVQIEKAAE